MIVLWCLLSYLACGFITGSLNQLIFKHTNSSYSHDRDMLFFVSVVLWPPVLAFDLVTLILGRGVRAWLDYLDSIPHRLNARRIRKQQNRRSSIEA